MGTLTPEDIEGLKQAIVRGDFATAVALTETALRAGESSERILSQAMMPAMEQLGSDFSGGIAFLPELIAGGHAMSEAAKLFARETPETDASVGSKVVVLGTAEGDLHDIGKNIVMITMQAVGLEVVDLGVDVPTERFVRAAEESGAHLVGISALLSTTMRAMGRRCGRSTSACRPRSWSEARRSRRSSRAASAPTATRPMPTSPPTRPSSSSARPALIMRP
jgi:5-methyltetrahydrofolate--homocysteine methyltransferase